MTKEEKLNYLKNKISMELKNPDTQQGFEIICKRLSELEKENAELKAKIEKTKTCSRCNSFDKDFDEYPCKDCFRDGVLTNWH